MERNTMPTDRTRRIDDLFVEGEECYLGVDGAGEPVVVWVNKINSFDEEDARRDGAVERGRRIAALSKPENEELVAMQAQLNSWDNDRLVEARIQQKGDQIALAALDDLEADHKELLDRVRRGGDLLADADAPDDDPRRAQLDEDQQNYFRLLREYQGKHFDELRDELTGLGRNTLVEDFLEAWRERAGMEGFMNEKRVSELFMAIRDCSAKVTHEEGGKRVYDHSTCDHSKRLYSARADIRKMPDQALDKIIGIYDNLGVALRESGNSDAPASSSASSEQRSKEEVSTPSTPAETSDDAPST